MRTSLFGRWLLSEPVGGAWRATAAASLSLVAGLCAPTAWAANHPLSSVQGADGAVLNLTANVNWDYDLPAPVQVGGQTLLTRELVEKQLLREMARSIYLMTEGRHRVGTVYVFKNERHGNNVDIRILNTEGHSSAAVGGWMSQVGTSNNYLTFEGQPESPFEVARVISHELGHYVYGFFDEYANSKTATSADPTDPVASDTPRATIMNAHTRFLRLSVAEDYRAGVTTAQSRGYGFDASGKGGSHWEMLVRDPSQDPPQTRQIYSRTRFQAFQGMQAPTSVQQLRFFPGVVCDADNSCEDGANGTQGVPAPYRLGSEQELQARLWELSGGSRTADAVDGAPGAFQNFRVEFVDSPLPQGEVQETRKARKAASVGKVLKASQVAMAQTAAISRHVIVLDRTLPEAAWRSAVATALGQLELYEDAEQVAVRVEPAAAGLPPFQMMPARDARTRWAAALQGVGGGAVGSLDMAALTSQALALLQAGRHLGAPASIELITAPASPGRSGPQVAEGLADTVRAQGVAVNVTRLRLAGSTGGVSSDLAQLAKGTGGAFVSARDENDALQSISRNMQLATGLVVASAGMDFYPPAAAGSTERLPFVLSDKFDTGAAVRWFHSPSDAGKLQFRVYNDAGQSYTQLSEESAPQEGFSIIELPEQALAQGGQWYAEVRRAGATADEVDAEAWVESSLTLVPSSLGGEVGQPQPPAVRARLATTLPLVGAQVLADIYRADDGTLVLEDVVLRDDGRSLDQRPNDGLYGANLSDKLPPGDYVALIRAETVAGSAFEPTQVFAKTKASSTTERIPVAPGLVRMDTESFTLEAGAPGVLPAPQPPTPSGDSGGGGCTSVQGQRDGGLLALLLAALAGLGLRRRAQRTPATQR